MSHLCQLWFSKLDQMIFGTLSFPGTRWYMVTARDPQMVRDQKSTGNHWPTRTSLVFVQFACSPGTPSLLAARLQIVRAAGMS